MFEDVLHKAIAQLRQERARIEYLIKVVEGLSEGKPRRGRPPKFILNEPAQQNTEKQKAAKNKSGKKKS